LDEQPNSPVGPRAGDPLADFFENGAVGLHLVASDGTILRANRAELAMLGYEAHEYIGRQISDFHADEDVIQDILARLSRGETLDKYAARLRAKDGSLRHVLISSSVHFDESGQFRNTRCFTLDVTDRVAAERELREVQQRLAATYENALAGIGEVDADGRFLRLNARFEELTGYSREELLQKTLFEITHPDDAAEERRQFVAQVLGTIDGYRVEKRYLHADGRVVWVHVMSSSVRDGGGRFLYGVRVVHDITDRRLAEQRSQLLINELNHRVKNTLATVQSLASQTARHTDEVGDFLVRFEGRLVALSKAHDRLTRRNWEGASLSELVQEELSLHAGSSRHVTFEGPDVALPPRAALSLSMAFHELGTNALKYGALSRPGGRIAVRWTVERDTNARPARVRLEWVESGGPAPSLGRRGGFGSRLLEAMAGDVNGTAELRFEPEGARWSLSFPLEWPA
jgi:PAS domain S-box-containing protein